MLRQLLPLRLNARYSDPEIRNALEFLQRNDKVVSMWVCDESPNPEVDLDEIQVWHGVLMSQKRKSWTVNYNVEVPELPEPISALNGATWVSLKPKVMTDKRASMNPCRQQTVRWQF